MFCHLMNELKEHGSSYDRKSIAGLKGHVNYILVQVCSRLL